MAYITDERDGPIIIACGPTNKTCECNCPESCEHVWDGPEVEWADFGWSVTCSRCGMAAIHHDLWVAP